MFAAPQPLRAGSPLEEQAGFLCYSLHPILDQPRQRFCLRHAYFLSSAVVSERFFNFLQNFAPQFPKKDVEEARSRCRIHGICFAFFDIPMSFPPFLFRHGFRKEPDALLLMRVTN
jgi:hypothetical protein